MPSPAERVTAKARTQISAFKDVRARVRWASSLKRLTEEAAQEYQGRFLIELVQNAFDVHPADRWDGRVHVRLDHGESEHGTLYVGNAGRPFTYENFDALSDIAQSSKVAGEGIGNKGLGFKSVLQVCEWPEVYSTSDAGPSNSAFDGYCFRFATEADLDVLVDDDDLRRAVVEDLSPYLLPVPIEARPAALAGLASQGMCTVIRLPLRSERARSLAAEQLAEMLASTAPVMLFLDRLETISFETCDEVGRSEQSTLTRHSVPVVVPEPSPGWHVDEVNLDPHGRFLAASRLVDPKRLTVALDESVAIGTIDPRWAKWDQQAWVTVAVRVDADDADWHMYTFLPMDVTSPMAAHVNAPFFTTLARGSFNPTVPLNVLLLDEVAMLCAETAPKLRDSNLSSARAALADLLAWKAEDHERLVWAFAERGENLAELALAPIMPRRDGASYGTFRQARQWVDSGYREMTAERLAEVCDAELLDPELGKERLDRLATFCSTLTGEDAAPTAETVAGWTERIARWLLGEPFDPQRWVDFYDDLAGALVGRASVLAGRRILLDDRRRLQPCRQQAAAPGTRAGRTIFFWPVRGTEGEEDLDPAVDISIPKELEEDGGVSFTHRDLLWYQGPQRTQRPGRRFLEESRLVQRYQTRELLEYVTALLVRPQSDEFYRAAIEFVFRLRERASALQPLDQMNLRVPTASGWATAPEAVFSKDWPNTLGAQMDRLIRLSGATSEEMAALRDRFLDAPSAWLPAGADGDAWTAFLGRVGVRDGLWPVPSGPERIEHFGSQFTANAIAVDLELAPTEAARWVACVPNPGGFPEYPWTDYVSVGRFWTLPGQNDHSGFTESARELYAQLIAEGVGAWKAECFEVGVRRKRYPNDPVRMWPTPLRAFLAKAAWVPVRPAEGQSLPFVTPAAAWRFDYSTEGAPTFAPIIRRAVARALERDQRALDRTAGLGMRTWNDPLHAGDLVTYLGELLATGGVGPGQPGFRKAYEEAWADVVRHRLGSPFVADEPGWLVVERGEVLAATPTNGPETVYVDDAAATPLTVQALAEIGDLRLCARRADGGAIVELLKPVLGDRAIPMSGLEVNVQVDGGPFEANGGEPFVGVGHEWLVDLMAAAVEFRSGPFHRPSDTEVREAAERMRRLRIVRAIDIRVEVDGREAPPSPAHRGVFPVNDPDHPAIIVTGAPSRLTWDLLERTSGALNDLVYSAAPALGPVLFQAFVLLRRLAGGDDDLTEPALDDLAEALGVRSEQIAEVRSILRSGLDQVVYLLEIAVCHFAVGHADAALLFGERAQSVATDEELAALLEVGGVPRASAVLVAAREAFSPGDFRERLDIGYAAFNAALQALGRLPLRDEAAHRQAFDVFVSRHHDALLGSVRLRFLEDYDDFRSLHRYLELRSLTGVDPDPEWLDICPVPSDDMMRERLDNWLDSQGAGSLSSYEGQLLSVDDLRRENLRTIRISEAWLARVVRAWSRREGKDPPELWREGTATPASAWADRQGILDFRPVDQRELLEWLVRAEHWPREIGTHIDLDVLGLREEDLDAAETEAEAERRQQERRRNSIELDGDSLSVLPGDLAALAEAVDATITPEFLKTRLAQAALDPVPQPPNKPGKKRRGGGTVAPERGLSDNQKIGLGLIGEVVALRWLKAKYPQGDVRWVSGYRHVFGGPEGDDSLGFDFEVLPAGGSEPLLFEVKAGGVATEFQLTPGEIEVARAKRGRYRILFIRHARDKHMRSIHMLPNPLRPDTRDLYRSRGQGVTYAFRLTGDDGTAVTTRPPSG